VTQQPLVINHGGRLIGKKIVYIAAGSRKWGAGHVRRSSQVINTLKKNGINLCAVAFVPDDADALMLGMFLHPYDIMVSSLNEIKTDGASAIVVDVDDDLQPEMLTWLKQTDLRVFALDLYINDNGLVKDKINLREGVSAFKYCIIREEFHQAKEKYAGVTPSYDAVVVVGGGDFRGHIATLLKSFKEDEYFLNKKIAVVMGPMVDDSLFNNKSFSENLIILKSPDNIAEIMANTYVGISNGGSSLMEFTMLGRPTVVFPQTAKEDAFINPFLENGSSIAGSLDRNTFKLQLKELWENHTLRMQMSEKARQLIDGFGAARIADKIINFL
jgi:spore coat polysaccharide biosynthesis predicted glycosyltransferase SpsG